jgi:hypothetical protein
MQSKFVQRLELDILEVKRRFIAIDIIVASPPGEFTKEEERMALSQVTTSTTMLAIHALIPGAVLSNNDPEDLETFFNIVKTNVIDLVEEMPQKQKEAENG